MFGLPLVRDRISARVKRASVELTEADLRLLSVAASHAAANPPIGWSHSDDRTSFDGLGRRMKRVADELHRTNTNGAATAGTAPRPDSLEVPR
jgi:hypothetical protein